DRQSCREGVPAVAHQEVIAAGERLVQVEGLDAAAAALALLAIECDKECRPTEALDDARSGDADHPRMPTLTRQHYRAMLRRVGVVGGNHLHCLVDHLAIKILAAPVERLEFADDLTRTDLVIGKQQLEPERCVCQTTRGVES